MWGSATETKALIVAFLAVGTFAPRAVNAQRLWSVGEATRAPDDPAVVVDGVAVVPRGRADVLPREAAEVQVTFDYLRLGFGYLELPLMDGTVIEAENAVFEDRGGGNLMWTGEVPGAGYESVLFTVQDGHLVGWFGEPGGPKYAVHAGPDGRGSLAVETGPSGDWCGVEAGPADVLRTVRGARAADRPVSVASEAGDNRLDILVLYTTGAEHFWRVVGGPAVGSQQYSDYLNMIFRNSAIPATANLIAVQWDPEVANRPSVNGYHHQHRGEGLWAWHTERRHSPEVGRMRTLHKPDMVYFLAWTRLSLFPELLGFNLGAGSLRATLEPIVHWGWNTVDYQGAFPHEVGHMLGGWHEPAELGGLFADARSSAVRPYAFGHTDLTSCKKREGFGEAQICPRTTMSYGVETWDDPLLNSVQEPFYSSVRHKPNGWTIGIAGTSEVERVFHETVPVAVRSGVDVASRPEQRPRTMTARWTGRDTVRITWSEDGRSRDTGGTLRLTLAEGANDHYEWRWDWKGGRATLREGRTSDNLMPIVEADGTQIGVDVAGLRPGGRYRMSVAGGSQTLEGGEWRRRDVFGSDVFELAPPGRSPGSPEAPSNVGASVTGPDSVRLSWRANSRVESGYEVWWRKWSGDEPDEVWRRYGQALRAGASSAEIRGLMAEEEIAVTAWRARWDPAKEDYVWVEPETTPVGRYSFLVVAYNERGFGASETLNYEFAPGPFPAPTRHGNTPACRWRASGLVLDGYEVEMCIETPDGERRRVWDYELAADRSGLLYFFDRDNVELLVKVLDGCGINGHRWVFVAPVTSLAFRLAIRERAPLHATRRSVWNYDSERRPQEQIHSSGTPQPWQHGESQDFVGNAQGRTARTVSDTTAFPCTAEEIAAAKAGATSTVGAAGLGSARAAPAAASPAQALGAGAATDCEPGAPALTLRGGYTVGLCFETSAGEIGDARDWGLDSSQSGLLYFFERSNAEVLIKVLDGCGVNGHRWVFVAPVTDLAFNLRVESPDGEVWTHTNRLGRTADAASDVSAFPCTS